MRKEIRNPQSGDLPRVKGPEMNDRDMLNDILATEKYLTDNFNIMQREASHQNLSNNVNVIMNQTYMCQRGLFNLMFEKGWYKMEAAERQDVEQVQQQFANYHSSQIPYSENVH